MKIEHFKPSNLRKVNIRLEKQIKKDRFKKSYFYKLLKFLKVADKS